MMTGQFPNQDQEPGYDETLNDDELYTKRDKNPCGLLSIPERTSSRVQVSFISYFLFDVLIL